MKNDRIRACGTIMRAPCRTGGRAGGTLSELSIYDYAVGITLAAAVALAVGQIEPILMLDQ